MKYGILFSAAVPIQPDVYFNGAKFLVFVVFCIDSNLPSISFDAAANALAVFHPYRQLWLCEINVAPI